MNITFVSDAVYPYNKGGKEKRLYELSTRLAKLGHDVHIYTMHWWDSPENDRVENGVKLHAISKLYPMYSGDRRSIKEGLLFGLACLKLMRVKFDVLDVDHMPFFPIYSAWVVCKLRRKQFFGTWHEALTRQDWVDYMGPGGAIAWMIEHVSIKLPTHITTSSPETQKLLSDIHGRKGPVALVTPGIDTTSMSAIAPAKSTCDVLYVGRLVKDKNVDKLVAAIGLIAQKNPAIRCVVIGHGLEKQRLAKQIKSLNLSSQVQLLDPLPKSEDIYAQMKASKVFCFPSIREGFGIVVLEALGCGTPVVTVDSPTNASKNLVAPGKNGSIVPADAQSLAEAIEAWISKPKPSSIEKQVASYGWSSLTDLQVRVYAA